MGGREAARWAGAQSSRPTTARGNGWRPCGAVSRSTWRWPRSRRGRGIVGFCSVSGNLCSVSYRFGRFVTWENVYRRRSGVWVFWPMRIASGLADALRPGQARGGRSVPLGTPGARPARPNPRRGPVPGPLRGLTQRAHLCAAVPTRCPLPACPGPYPLCPGVPRVPAPPALTPGHPVRRWLGSTKPGCSKPEQARRRKDAYGRPS